MARSTDTVVVYKRKDKKFDWKRSDSNGEELCQSTQGYENPKFAWGMAHELCSDLQGKQFFNETGHDVTS